MFDECWADCFRRSRQSRFSIEKEEHPICAMPTCGKASEEVHEARYANEGHWPSNELFPVCSTCHRLITEGQRIVGFPPRSIFSEAMALSMKYIDESFNAIAKDATFPDELRELFSKCANAWPHVNGGMLREITIDYWKLGKLSSLAKDGLLHSLDIDRDGTVTNEVRKLWDRRGLPYHPEFNPWFLKAIQYGENSRNRFN